VCNSIFAAAPVAFEGISISVLNAYTLQNPWLSSQLLKKKARMQRCILNEYTLQNPWFLHRFKKKGKDATLQRCSDATGNTELT
jgi:hypothetical protein